MDAIERWKERLAEDRWAYTKMSVGEKRKIMAEVNGWSAKRRSGMSIINPSLDRSVAIKIFNDATGLPDKKGFIDEAIARNIVREFVLERKQI